MLSFWFYLILVVFLVLCVAMIGLILIQRGRGGGIASAFGGAGGNTAFGSKTGDVLTWATSIVFGIFLVMAVGLNLLATAVNKQVTSAPVTPVQTAPVEEGLTPSTAPTEVPVVPPEPAPQDAPGAEPVPAAPAPVPESAPAGTPAPSTPPSL
jgi:preprotein translocase subunit SecG